MGRSRATRWDRRRSYRRRREDTRSQHGFGNTNHFFPGKGRRHRRQWLQHPYHMEDTWAYLLRWLHRAAVSKDQYSRYVAIPALFMVLGADVGFENRHMRWSQPARSSLSARRAMGLTTRPSGNSLPKVQSDRSGHVQIKGFCSLRRECYESTLQHVIKQTRILLHLMLWTCQGIMKPR